MIEAEQQRIENEKKRLELVSAYKRFAQSDDGKIIMNDLEVFCGFLNTSVSPEFNSHQTMFAEGKRRVFLRIKGMLRRKEND